MTVERIPAGVELAAAKPTIERRTAVIEHLVPPLIPIERGGGFRPEFFGIGERAAMFFLLPASHDANPPRFRKALSNIVSQNAAPAKLRTKAEERDGEPLHNRPRSQPGQSHAADAAQLHRARRRGTSQSTRRDPWDAALQLG